MTVTPQKLDPEGFTPESDLKFDWKNCWYPVTFVQDFPSDRPYSFSIYNQPLVLFQDQTGELICLTDRCSHRAAKLSDGQIIDGKIECLYHGWQFGSQGECVHIPQLDPNGKIPKAACIQSYKTVKRQGIIWVWLGDSEIANVEQIPTVPYIDQPNLFRVDTVSDLPIDQTHLIENAVDPAHVYISHDRTESVKREDAQPLIMEIVSTSVKGIEGRYRLLNVPQMPWVKLEFIAPHLVLYYFGNRLILTIYMVPLAPGRSRILIRRSRNSSARWFKLKPRWLEHLRQNKVLEEDLYFIKAQEDFINQSGQTIKQTYLPLKTADVLVMAYRKWLDQFGSELPHYQGYMTAQHDRNRTEVDLSTRYLRHTQICSSCQKVYQTTQRVQKISLGLAIFLAALSLVLDGKASMFAVSLALLAVGITAIASQLKERFEQESKR